MWVGLLFCLSIIHPSRPYLYNNNDEASLLDRLMSSDYLEQDDRIQPGPRAPFSELPDYPIYQDLAPRPRYLPQGQMDYPGPVAYHIPSPAHHSAPEAPRSPAHKATHDAPRHAPQSAPPKIQFPNLSAKLKQFAVNPGYPEYYGEHPDFLKFRLQELEESKPGPETHGQAAEAAQQPLPAQDQELEEQLQAMTANLGHSGQSDSKRAMVGGVRAEPLIASEYGGEYTQEEQADDLLFTTIIAVCTAASVFAVIGAGFCYHRSSGRAKEQEEVEYPAYGVTGPAKEASPAGDRKLAQSAQMYHYQHQKNQMIAINRGNGGPGNHSGGEESEGEMEGEGEEGDYTVYECPGLASTDEMEVKNPLFNDDPTPKNP